ncbi:ABC transporter substrate-binding protein [Nocardioides limicola]|uniref:ABC transporter substrate-binding protein n=1 Tax=Nocardioides limicola TaxID=2803368 RepID=UPI00193C6EF7|nr:ABC transporter substrate-binding protein [Nocardioides sp. DJM-14]
MRMPRRTRTMALAIAVALGLAACGGNGGETSSGQVTIWMSLDETVVDGLTEEIMAKAEEAGIDVKVERVDSIDVLVKTRIQAGNPPDIALVPQPGVVASIVELGAAYPLDDVLDLGALEDSMVPGAIDAGMVDGQLYGLLTSMNVKSLLFYPKKAFEDAGYETPNSLDELTALADQIRGDGGTPWCLTMESGAATGWVATDWFEDLIMRVGSPEEYNQWVAGEIPFDSDVVREAAAYFEEVAFTEGNVQGGRRAIAATPFGDAARPMFNQAGPQCWLLKQGSFFVAPDFLPDRIFENADEELGVTGFPPAEVGGENPVMGGGDLAVLLSDNPDAQEAMRILAQADVGNTAATNSSFLSPHRVFDVSLYANDTVRNIAGVAYDATAFLFDGSDSMPAQVGAGTFWTEMTDWISGRKSLDDALTTIDNSWPAN